jgi:hypothetical protein
MMRWWLLLTALAAAAMTAFAGAALASVTFDDTNGTGTVDRVDVQTAFGWTNAQFGQNKRDVTFTRVVSDGFSWLCSSGATPSTSTGTTIVVENTWRGKYVLLGYGARTETGIPVSLGDPCPNGDGSTVVQLLDFQPTPVFLYANYNGQTALLAVVG